jgi:SAM-dependent methyltransferase
VAADAPATLIERLHGRHVHARRTRVLTRHLAALLPSDARVLDVGCGDGRIDQQILRLRQDRLHIEGIDVLVRPGAHIPVRAFDGATIPNPDGSFDAVMFVDVLHHTLDAMALLREAVRVTRAGGLIVIKDHTLQGLLAGPTLRFMDRVGNARHGVALPYNYWTPQQWFDAIKRLRLSVVSWNKRVGLYPFPANVVLGRSLHFVAALRTPSVSADAGAAV